MKNWTDIWCTPLGQDCLDVIQLVNIYVQLRKQRSTFSSFSAGEDSILCVVQYVSLTLKSREIIFGLCHSCLFLPLFWARGSCRGKAMATDIFQATLSQRHCVKNYPPPPTSRCVQCPEGPGLGYIPTPADSLQGGRRGRVTSVLLYRSYRNFIAHFLCSWYGTRCLLCINEEMKVQTCKWLPSG